MSNNQQLSRCKNCLNRKNQQGSTAVNIDNLNSTIARNLQSHQINLDELMNINSKYDDLAITITEQELKELNNASSLCLNEINNKSSFKDAKELNTTNNWQNRKMCIIDRLSHMYLNEELADVYFIVGRENESKERFPAHRFVLSIGSSVFNAMFYGPCGQNMTNGKTIVDSNRKEIHEIDIPDIDAQSFKCLLKYLYTDEIIIEADTVMSILYISKKYSVLNLENECVNYLKLNLRVDNVFMLLSQAKLFDEYELFNLCLELIDKYAYDAMQTEYFLEIDLDTLKIILKRDTLNIEESKLFEIVVKWCQVQCEKNNLEINSVNLKAILDDAIYLIRFPLMTKEEFALTVENKVTRLLNDEQIIDFFLYFTLNDKKRQLEFSQVPRSGKFKDSFYTEQVVNRFCHVDSRWGYSGTSDRIRFSVDKRIYIVGVGFYGSIYGKCEYQVMIQLIHFETCTICGQNNTQFSCDGSSSTFRVQFCEPIELIPNDDYILAATLKGPDSYYGTKGMRTVVHENQINGNKVTFQFQYASGNNNGSSVEDGQLPELIFVYNIK